MLNLYCRFRRKLGMVS